MRALYVLFIIVVVVVGGEVYNKDATKPQQMQYKPWVYYN